MSTVQKSIRITEELIKELKAAIGCWKTHPVEIDNLITQNEGWTKEHIQER